MAGITHNYVIDKKSDRVSVAAKGVDIAGNILPYTVHITHNLKIGSSHPHDVVLLDVGQAVPQEGPGAT